MSNKKISVILPVLTATQESFERCISSILGQTYRNFELIIVNENRDTTFLKDLESYENKDNRIKILNLIGGKNLPYALNFGINASCGEFIARIDADDFCVDNRFQVQLEFLSKNPDVSVVGSAVFINQLGANELIRRYPEHNANIWSQLHFTNPICHPSVMIRSKDLYSVGLYDDLFDAAEDYELWCRFISAGYKLANISEPLLHYSLQENEARDRKNWKFNLKVKLKYFHVFDRKISAFVAISMIAIIYLLPKSAVVLLYKLRNKLRKI